MSSRRASHVAPVEGLVFEALAPSQVLPQTQNTCWFDSALTMLLAPIHNGDFVPLLSIATCNADLIEFVQAALFDVPAPASTAPSTRGRRRAATWTSPLQSTLVRRRAAESVVEFCRSRNPGRGQDPRGLYNPPKNLDDGWWVYPLVREAVLALGTPSPQSWFKTPTPDTYDSAKWGWPVVEHRKQPAVLSDVLDVLVVDEAPNTPYIAVSVVYVDKGRALRPDDALFDGQYGLVGLWCYLNGQHVVALCKQSTGGWRCFDNEDAASLVVPTLEAASKAANHMFHWDKHHYLALYRRRASGVVDLPSTSGGRGHLWRGVSIPGS